MLFVALWNLQRRQRNLSNRVSKLLLLGLLLVKGVREVGLFADVEIDALPSVLLPVCQQEDLALVLVLLVVHVSLSVFACVAQLTSNRTIKSKK